VSRWLDAGTHSLAFLFHRDELAQLSGNLAKVSKNRENSRS
jgi:hypothetical protein